MTQHDHSHHYQNRDNLKIAFFINLGFTLFEIVGGLAINSVAILSDALHDLGDSFSLGLAWFLEGYADKASDQKYTYGYRRFSLLGALINAVILVGGSLFILSETIPRLLDPQAFNTQGMIFLAVIGVAVNGIAALRLRNTESTNTQVIGWHLIEDVLGWVVVLIVGVVSLFVDLPILDPILSILITLYVLWNVIGRLKSAVELFLQAVPKNIDLAEIQNRILQIDGVQSIHHMHIWSLDGERNVFSTHLVVDSELAREAALKIKQASRAALADLNLEHTTIELEYEGEDCSIDAAEPSHTHLEGEHD